MSVHLKCVFPTPIGDCSLNQRAETLKDNDLPGQLRAVYLVRHTNEDYKTTVFNDMLLDVQIPYHIVDPGCKATMLIETPWMETPQEAVDKLADWLERLAMGLRDGTARGGFGIQLVSPEAKDERK